MPAKASLILILLVVGFAATAAADPASPSVADLVFVESLAGQSRAETGCATPESGKLLAPWGAKPMSACSATANCLSGTVSCTGNNSCQAVDQNCSSSPQQLGYVTCDGVTTRCPLACDGCAPLDWCCHCAATSDCHACCKCNGGTWSECTSLCGGG